MDAGEHLPDRPVRCELKRERAEKLRPRRPGEPDPVTRPADEAAELCHRPTLMTLPNLPATFAPGAPGTPLGAHFFEEVIPRAHGTEALGPLFARRMVAGGAALYIRGQPAEPAARE